MKFFQDKAVAPQHISIAIGPFEEVNLSEFRDQENEDTLAAMAVDVMGYCLPGREADLKNTCMFMPKVLLGRLLRLLADHGLTPTGN